MQFYDVVIAADLPERTLVLCIIDGSLWPLESCLLFFQVTLE